MARYTNEQLQLERQRKQARADIDFARLQLRKKYPQMADVKPSENEIEELVTLLVEKRYVEYSSKFESLFKI